MEKSGLNCFHKHLDDFTSFDTLNTILLQQNQLL